MDATTEITAAEWILALLQVVLGAVSIWIGIYFYLKQQQAAQNEKYDTISSNLEGLRTEIKALDKSVSALEGQINGNILELKEKVALVQNITSQTQDKIWLSHNSVVDRVITTFISDKIALKEITYESQEPLIEIESAKHGEGEDE